MLAHTQQLLAIMARLRDPQTGCPWDLKQNFQSLTPYVIEEAYEVVDAIERNDLDDLRYELGDLLLQVVFQAQLAKEQGLFDFEQVAQGINDKLIRRHPHVFAGAVFETDNERHRAWEQAKADERNEKGRVGSILDGIAKSLPALVECKKVQDRAADHGFDWLEILPVFDKVQEELDEVKEAWHSGDKQHIEEEIGDLLLVVVNLARHLDLDAEATLKKSTQKFTKRFQHVEQLAKTTGKDLRACSLNELNDYWNQAKSALKST